MNWNTKKFLLKCLASIESFPPHCQYEVIVVDNNSSDGSAEAVAEQFPKVTLFAQANNLGYALGNNVGIKNSTGSFILTLNPDTEVYQDTLDNAIQALIRLPQAGAIGAQQIAIDGSTQHSVRGFPTVGGVFWDAIGLAKMFKGTKFDQYRLNGFDYQIEQQAPQPMGTFLLFRRSALKAIGDDSQPFDLQFPIFFNEVDLLYRLNQAGWPCWYVPRVKVLHYGGESTKLVRKSIIWESHKSLLRYWRKHASSFKDWLGLFLATLPILTVAFVRAKGYDRGFRVDGYNLQLEHENPDSKVP